MLTAEILTSVRPYLKAYVTDFAIFLLLYLMLWSAHALAGVLPISAAGVRLLSGVHETATVLSYAVLAVFCLWDTIRLKRRQHFPAKAPSVLTPPVPRNRLVLIDD